MRLAPAKAAMAAGTLKRATTRQSACLAIKPNLKILLAKCTTAVAAIASGSGKNNAKTGISTVPRPKPEKSVRPEMSSAETQIKTSSICEPPSNNRISISTFDYYEPIPIESKRTYDQHAHWRPQPVVCFSHLSAPWSDLFRRPHRALGLLSR